MDLGPALLPVAPELGVMSRRAPSLVWERLRAPSLVWERLRAPSRDVTLEPEAVRERIRRVILAEGTGEREKRHPVRDPVRECQGHPHASNGPSSCLGASSCLTCLSLRPSSHRAPHPLCIHSQRRRARARWW